MMRQVDHLDQAYDLLRAKTRSLGEDVSFRGESFGGYRKKSNPPLVYKVPKSEIMSFLFAAHHQYLARVNEG